MSRIRANKITDKLGTGAPQLEKGAELPIGMGLTGAGGINISGVITATSFSGSGANLSSINATSIKDSGGNIKIQAQASGAVYTGIHTFTTLNSSTGTFSGAIDANGDLDVDGHTNLDNVSISGVATVTGNLNVGGVLTYEDVTNVDSVGIVTARLGVRVPDDVYSYFGTGNDLSIRHDASGGNHSYIFNNGAGVFKLGSNTQFIIGKTSNATYIQANPDGDVKLYYNNNQKLATSNTGVTVTGTLAATAVTGDGSGLTNLAVGLSTEALVKTNGQTATLNLSKDDHKVTATGTVTIDTTGGTESENHTLRIVNNGTATINFSSKFLFPSGGSPNLPTASGAISLISFTVHQTTGTVKLLAGASVNFS